MLRVLIVEDEDMIRSGLVYTYDWLGHGCTVVGEAADGKRGLALIRELAPDVVISDIRMPEMDGLEMIRQASESNSFFSILLTGYSEFEYAKQALTLKVTEYLLKPVDEKKLSLALEGIRAELETRAAAAQKLQMPLPQTDIDALFEPGRRLNYYVGCAVKIIRDGYPSRLSVREIAQQLDVSESYLSRKFKEELGSTFGEFLNKYRVQKALELLSRGGVRISEVSEQVGFREYKYFSEVFKKHTGMSCSEFTSTALYLSQKP